MIHQMTALMCALVLLCPTAEIHAQPIDPKLSAKEITALTKDAFIYAYPMLNNYRTMYGSSINEDAKRFRAPLNKLVHFSQLLDHRFTQVVSPNNDTLYSPAWLNLRAEPMVLSVPEIRDGRYYVFQMIDVYTHNFAYVGTRTTGSKAGRYLIAGPNWKGETPKGIDKVFQSEGQFVLLLGRTFVAGPKDVPNVRTLQKQYQMVPLSTFLKKPAPKVPPMKYPKYDEKKARSAGFIQYLNFLLANVKIHPDEQKMIQEWAKIGIRPGADFDPTKLTEKQKDALERGVAQGLKTIEEQASKLSKPRNGWLNNGAIFGNREQMQGKYLIRACAAHIALYGNSPAEAIYPATFVDAKGRKLSGKNRYELRFEKDQLPPVNAFWSLTMYRLPERLFVPNEGKRYALGDRSANLKYGKDGSLTMYLQRTSPGKEKEANWLPTPEGEFYLLLRLFWPKAEALGGKYVPPAVQQLDEGK